MYKKLLIVFGAALIGLPLIILLWLFVIRQSGFKVNKKYFMYDRKACLQKVTQKDIEGCIFWARANSLEKDKSWENEFNAQYNANECKIVVTKKPGSTINLFDDFVFPGEGSPECFYESFKHQKRLDKWGYLISKEQDGAYFACKYSACPKEPLFK